jgi:threonyl-tRNA synthetase
MIFAKKKTINSGFFDLCRGGHTYNPAKDIVPGSWKLSRVAGAYWRGDEKNKMLTRIYGLSFESKEALEAYEKLQDEAKKRDHKKLGRELDLFTFSDLVGAGLPLWTPKGTLVRTLLDDFVWELRKKREYMKVEIPHITKKELYEVSGHWAKFKDELFRIKTREGHEFAMKPMNCPHHTQIYARKAWSYRELPQRYANTTTCYRDEQTGELSGLSRVRAFAQDDAHVFCRVDQVKDEFLKIWDIIQEFYSAFGFTLRARLSLHDPAHPEKYLGDKEVWAKAEGTLREIVDSKKLEWFEGIGEAAFYGPKLDFMAKDAIGRDWQVATIQLDMNMPERFDLSCTNEKGEKERIVMIHAAIMGSIERFMSILIEHTAGQFPLWLSPVQIAIAPVGEKFNDAGKMALEAFNQAGIRAELLELNDSLGKKIRQIKVDKIPYWVVIGEKEATSKTVTLENRKGEKESLSLEDTVKKLTEEIRNRV